MNFSKGSPYHGDGDTSSYVGPIPWYIHIIAWTLIPFLFFSGLWVMAIVPMLLAALLLSL